MTTTHVRAAAVAGLFYPADPALLRNDIHRYLDAVTIEQPADPRALVCPHAGYVYCGSVAAHAYANIAHLRDRIRTVVIVGPAHYLRVRGVAAPTVGAFETPLGTVPVATELVERACAEIPGVIYNDGAHEPEHSLEVQLPFLQETLGDFEVAPFLGGVDSDATITHLLESVWRADGMIIIASSDLSHFQPYVVATEHDRATAEAIQQIRPELLRDNDACGRSAVSGLLRFARAHGFVVRTLDLKNSGDTVGGRHRVVGYGAFILT